MVVAMTFFLKEIRLISKFCPNQAHLKEPACTAGKSTADGSFIPEGLISVVLVFNTAGFS